MTPTSMRSLSPLVTGEHATKVVAQVLESTEHNRRDLAILYANTEGGSTIEHEVGECLTQIRKASVRLRKAIGELAQQQLPLEN